MVLRLGLTALLVINAIRSARESLAPILTGER